MEKEKPEKICFNCNQFFPACMGESTEFGICLNDESFEPFIDELFEDRKTAVCQELVDCRKITGEREACKDFEEIEEGMEIDENSPLGAAVSHFLETGELDVESLKAEILDEQIRNIDLESIPVEEYAAALRSSDPDERDSGISSLAGLISFRNREAFKELFIFFKELPPPVTIVEVHFKLELLRDLNRSEERTMLIPELIDELYRTVSNNTTRQWISGILRFLELCPWEEVYEPLEAMLSDKRFSYRLKEKIERILDL